MQADLSTTLLPQDPVRKLCGWQMWTIKAVGAAFAAGVLAACAWGMTRADPGVVSGAFGVVDDLKVAGLLTRTSTQTLLTRLVTMQLLQASVTHSFKTLDMATGFSHLLAFPTCCSR